MANSKKVKRARLSIASGDNSRYGCTDTLKKKIHERDDHACRYCLSPSQCIDHIIPASFGRDNHPDNLVACCNFCNMVLGNKLFDNFSHKRAYMINWYDKYLPKAAALVWTIDEIKELGYNLRTKMLQSCIIVENEGEAEKARKILREQRIHIVLGTDDIEII